MRLKTRIQIVFLLVCAPILIYQYWLGISILLFGMDIPLSLPIEGSCKSENEFLSPHSGKVYAYACFNEPGHLEAASSVEIRLTERQGNKTLVQILQTEIGNLRETKLRPEGTKEPHTDVSTFGEDLPNYQCIRMPKEFVVEEGTRYTIQACTDSDKTFLVLLRMRIPMTSKKDMLERYPSAF